MDTRIAEFVRRKQRIGRRYRAQPYPSWVRSEALALLNDLKSQGMGLRQAARRLELRWETLRRWQHAEASESLVPVRVVAPHPQRCEASGGLRVVSPDGWRVEGLDLYGAVSVLERLR